MEREALLAAWKSTECAKCTREAITVTNDGMALCARHATIFMTAQRLQARNAETRSLTAAGR